MSGCPATIDAMLDRTTLGQGIGEDFVPQERAAAVQRVTWLTPNALSRWLDAVVAARAWTVHSSQVSRYDQLDAEWHLFGPNDALLRLPLSDWLVYHRGVLSVMSPQRYGLFRGDNSFSLDGGHLSAVRSQVLHSFAAEIESWGNTTGPDVATYLRTQAEGV
jgi:hypothetical protein